MAGEYQDRPPREKVISVADASLRLCLLEKGGDLLVFGPRRGTALHILLLQAFARAIAQKLLGEKIFLAAARLGYGQFAFRIGDQRRRWGSCSRRSGRLPKICLNWRALLLAPELLDELCLHELSHLREMNHSPAFYALLLAVNPDARQAERALGRAFAKLPYWATHASHFSRLSSCNFKKYSIL